MPPPYLYEAERPRLFTDHGQALVFRLHQHVRTLLAASGCCTMERAIQPFRAEPVEESMLFACMDRLKELNFVYEVPRGPTTLGRIFVPGKEA